MVLPTKEDNMYDDFDSPYVDHCYVCGGVDQCDEVAHDMADDMRREVLRDELDRCAVCGMTDQCDEIAHDMASEEPYAYDEEPIYDPWQDERYTFMTTGAPF